MEVVDGLDVRTGHLGAVTGMFPGSGPVFVAHRHGNSLGGLRRAEAAGADVVEADIFLRRGRIEVRHSKTLGPLPVLWDRWLLERGWGQRLLLEDVVAAADAGTLLMLDIKRAAPGLSALLRDSMESLAPGRPYLVCSQAWDTVEPFEDVAGATPVYSVDSERALHLFRRRFGEGASAICSIHQRLLDEGTAASLRSRTELVMSWPVNDRARAEQIMAWGIRGMITDRLELVTARTG